MQSIILGRAFMAPPILPPFKLILHEDCRKLYFSLLNFSCIKLTRFHYEIWLDFRPKISRFYRKTVCQAIYAEFCIIMYKQICRNGWKEIFCRIMQVFPADIIVKVIYAEFCTRCCMTLNPCPKFLALYNPTLNSLLFLCKIHSAWN